jgi:TM2 domain-containing membrane protein YozV
VAVKRFRLILVAILSFVACKSAFSQTDSLPAQPLASVADSAIPETHALRSAAASAVVPGLGQVLNGRYTRGALYLGSEVALSLGSWYFFDEAALHLEQARRLGRIIAPLRDKTIDSTFYVQDSLQSKTLYMEATPYELAQDTAEYEWNQSRYRASQALSWTIGLYLYGIMDAAGSSGYFHNSEERSPVVAGWLSAVPALGLGQLYNGKVGKAGMILMVQGSLGVIALQNHLLMTQAERAINQLSDTSCFESRVPGAPSYRAYWERNREQNFRTRNMYLWYSIFFYFYGVFDAVVDAHLHDFERRIQLEPDLRPSLQPQATRVGLQAQVRF